MEELKAQGLTKSIGVSNYLPEHLDFILETCKTPPAVNQIEFHPYLQHPGLLQYHKEKVRTSTATPSPQSDQARVPFTLHTNIASGYRNRSLRSTNANHERRRRPSRQYPQRPGAQIRRQPRRDLFEILHRPGHRAHHDLEQGTEAERLPARHDV